MSVTPSVNAKVRSPGLRPNRQQRGFKVDGPTLKNDDNSLISLSPDKLEVGDKLTLTDRMEDSIVNRLGAMLGRTALKLESDIDLRVAGES